MRCGVNSKVRSLSLFFALSGAAGANAQVAPNADEAQAAQPEAALDAPGGGEVAASPATSEPTPAPQTAAAQTPAPPTPAPPPSGVSVFPPPPPPSPATLPPAAGLAYQPAPTRIVMLVPHKRAVRPRQKPVFGDAGAPFSIGAGLSFSWPSDRGYALAGHGDRLTHGELFAAYDVWQPVNRLVLSLGANYRALIGGNDRAEVSERALQADLTARFTATRWLFPHIRAAGGGIRTGFRITDRGGSQSSGNTQGVTYTDKDWAPVATLGAGFTLRTKARAFESDRGGASSLSLGVLVEGGYILAPAATLRLVPESSPSSGSAVKPTQAGSLDRSAPYLRVAGVFRF